MNLSRFGKFTCVASMFYIAMIFSTGLQAGPIATGQFSLHQDDSNSNGIDEGELVATVLFTAEDTATLNVDGLSIFNVTRLEMIDQTALLDRDNVGGADGVSLIGNFLYDADPMAMPAGTATVDNPPLIALYSPTNAFVGIDGALRENNPLRFVSFSVNGVTLFSSTAGTYNTGNNFTDSYNLVTEPSALALLGIGLIGFGAVRLRAFRS